MTTPDFDLLVIGAGISGLTFARSAVSAGRTCMVLESAPQIGGALRSERTAQGYWFELGAHTLYNSYGTLLAHLEAMGLKDSIRPRIKAPYRLLVDGKLRSIPSQIGKAELFGAVWRAFSARKEGKSVREYYGHLVGEKNWQKVFAPLLSAVPSQRADDFPADMLFKKRPRRKDIPRTFTLDGGLGALVKALAQVPGVDVRTGAKVTALSKREGAFDVLSENGHTYRSKQVALALPPNEAASLLATVLPSASDKLRQIKQSTIDSVGVVARRGDLKLPSVAGIIPLQDDFFSMVSRDVVPDEAYRAATFHFRGDMSPEARLARIESVLDLPRDRFVHTAQNRVALPSPGHGHADLVESLDKDLVGTGIFVTGNYFGGLAIEDCALRSKKESERLLSTSR